MQQQQERLAAVQKHSKHSFLDRVITLCHAMQFVEAGAGMLVQTEHPLHQTGAALQQVQQQRLSDYKHSTLSRCVMSYLFYIVLLCT